jgi:hypothetical protein
MEYILNEEFHNLYPSPSINRMIKSRRMRWAGHVARMRKKREADRILVRVRNFSNAPLRLLTLEPLDQIRIPRPTSAALFSCVNREEIRKRRGTMLQAGRSQVRFSMRSLDFSIDLILPAVL